MGIASMLLAAARLTQLGVASAAEQAYNQPVEAWLADHQMWRTDYRRSAPKLLEVGHLLVADGGGVPWLGFA